MDKAPAVITLPSTGGVYQKVLVTLTFNKGAALPVRRRVQCVLSGFRRRVDGLAGTLGKHGATVRIEILVVLLTIKPLFKPLFPWNPSRSHVRSAANLTDTSCRVSRRRIDVLSGQRMAALAVSLTCFLGQQSATAKNILAPRHRFKMSWVNAPPVRAGLASATGRRMVAQMVKRGRGWFAMLDLPRNAVRLLSLFTPACIASADISLPYDPHRFRSGH